MPCSYQQFSRLAATYNLWLQVQTQLLNITAHAYGLDTHTSNATGESRRLIRQHVAALDTCHTCASKSRDPMHEAEPLLCGPTDRASPLRLATNAKSRMRGCSKTLPPTSEPQDTRQILEQTASLDSSGPAASMQRRKSARPSGRPAKTMAAMTWSWPIDARRDCLVSTSNNQALCTLQHILGHAPVRVATVVGSMWRSAYSSC
jgi:hypothetical protein